MIIIKSNGFEYYIGINAIKLKLNNRSLEDILGIDRTKGKKLPDMKEESGGVIE